MPRRIVEAFFSISRRMMATTEFGNPNLCNRTLRQSAGPALVAQLRGFSESVESVELPAKALEFWHASVGGGHIDIVAQCRCAHRSSASHCGQTPADRPPAALPAGQSLRSHPRKADEQQGDTPSLGQSHSRHPCCKSGLALATSCCQRTLSAHRQ